MFKVRTALLWLSFDVALSDATSLDAANWMASNLEWLGEKTLKELCIPGTHNSGMNKLFGGTAFAKPCNIVNQDRNIRRQLELGIRFFDIRPVLAKGGYRTGHYTKVFGGVWQGGYGHAIRTIVDNINAFTQTHSEVIFLRLSHTHNTDDGYRPFNQTEWNKLFDILDKTENLYHGPEDTYFPVLTLETLLDYGNKSAVIYIVDEPNNVVYLGSRVGKGFFYHYSLNLFDQYSSTNKIDFLYMDQLAKMKRMAKRRYFLLSWTLTQTGFDATMCPTMGKSTKDLALLAGKRLRSMLAQVTNYVYPNIINSDFVDSTELTEITMTINLKWLSLK